MIRRTFLSRLALPVLCLALPLRVAARPNVIVVVTDDQRANELWPMPTVSALASQGAVFDGSFVPTSLCCPSRLSLLTGNYAHTHGLHVLGDAIRSIGPDRETIAVWLQRRGYRTGFFGKYLNGYSTLGPPERPAWYIPPGWDEWHAFASDPHYYDYSLVDQAGTLTSYGSSDADYSTDVLRNLALGFVDEALRQRERFLLYFCPFAPHDDTDDSFLPIPAPQDVTSFPGLALPEPPNFNEMDVGDKPLAIRQLPLLGPVQQGYIAAIYVNHIRSLLAVDRAMADLLALLDRYGARRNTLIVFTSDNGYAFGEHRLTGKQCPYEECLRVPIVLSYPGVRGGPRPPVRPWAVSVDIAPTVAAFAHVPAPSVDGRSLRPELRDPSGTRWPFPLEEWNQDGSLKFRGVRTGRYKYVEYSATGERELYDERVDPYELENRADDPGKQALSRTLRRLTLHLRAGSSTIPAVPFDAEASSDALRAAGLPPRMCVLPARRDPPLCPTAP